MISQGEAEVRDRYSAVRLVASGRLADLGEGLVDVESDPRRYFRWCS